MNKHLLGLLLLCPWLAQAAPDIRLEASLNPEQQSLKAKALVQDNAGLSGFYLHPDFVPGPIKLNETTEATDIKPDARGWYSLPEGTTRVELSYEAKLEPLSPLDHRQVLSHRKAVAGAEGSFLPAASGWYPTPEGLFTWHVTLELPAGHKGLVPGNRTSEMDSALGYRAEFESNHPAEGIDFIAGPYKTQDAEIQLDSGKKVRLRTWFHPELQDLAQGYLDDTAGYIKRFSRLIGDYPFADFGIVSSPTPTGFGMPSLTYLGREVLRLPFIRASSLGHEVLHNWWGNGVYPEWRQGNWSEGLTTFMADYAFKKEEGEEAARQMRLGWLRDLASVPPEQDYPLSDFVSRQHGIASVIGYNKAAMVFLMLKDQIGEQAFLQGIRAFWQRKQFQTASWADLEAAFSEAANRPLSTFFQQWINQRGAPRFKLTKAWFEDGQLQVRLTQEGHFHLSLPLRLTGPAGFRNEWLDIPAKPEHAFSLPPSRGPTAVELDPDYRLWRHLNPEQLPPILRELWIAHGIRFKVLSEDAEFRNAAAELARKLIEGRLLSVEETGPMLVIADSSASATLKEQEMAAPEQVAAKGSARVWSGRDANQKAWAVIEAKDIEALKALSGPLPHHGRQSWLVFEGAKAIEKGIWPVLPESLKIETATQEQPK
jgi:hypothetical protein